MHPELKCDSEEHHECVTKLLNWRFSHPESFKQKQFNAPSPGSPFSPYPPQTPLVLEIVCFLNLSPTEKHRFVDKRVRKVCPEAKHAWAIVFVHEGGSRGTPSPQKLIDFRGLWGIWVLEAEEGWDPA